MTREKKKTVPTRRVRLFNFTSPSPVRVGCLIPSEGFYMTELEHIFASLSLQLELIMNKPSRALRHTFSFTPSTQGRHTHRSGGERKKRQTFRGARQRHLPIGIRTGLSELMRKPGRKDERNSKGSLTCNGDEILDERPRFLSLSFSWCARQNQRT